uniref:Uncharacterized protein n=1 Tax=Arundo donax TaxID=35708 RepID=A0A0A9BQQ6_ARUDO
MNDGVCLKKCYHLFCLFFLLIFLFYARSNVLIRHADT